MLMPFRCRLDPVQGDGTELTRLEESRVTVPSGVPTAPVYCLDSPRARRSKVRERGPRVVPRTVSFVRPLHVWRLTQFCNGKVKYYKYRLIDWSGHFNKKKNLFTGTVMVIRH